MRTHLMTAIGVALFACTAADNDVTSDTTGADSPASMAAPDPSVTAVVRDASGRDLGTLTFSDTNGGIAVSGSLSGLAPGEHGLHLHMTGRCDPPAFESAGSHWNPTNRQHGSQNAEGPHLGDLPNVSVGSDSSATVQGVTPGGTLRGATDMLLDQDGAAVIVHTGPDDHRTNPSGGSGAPVACGVLSGA